MRLNCEDLKKWLKTYPPMKIQEENLNEQLARMKSAEQFPPMDRGGEGGKGSGPADPMGKMVSSRVDLERKMENTVRKRRREMAEIEDAILMLPDSMQQQCLWLRYIDVDSCDPTPWKTVAKKIYRNDSDSRVRMVQNLHGDALASMLKVMQKGVTL